MQWNALDDDAKLHPRMVLQVFVAPDGDHFASRVEFYPTGPDDEPDPDKLKTIVSIKLKD